MRLLKLIFLAVLCLALVIIALANRDPMTLQLLPAELSRVAGVQWEVTMPIFLVILAAVFAGLAIGFIWEWLREHKHRAAAVSERRERERLEQQVEQVSPKKPADDVLAILDS